MIMRIMMLQNSINTACHEPNIFINDREYMKIIYSSLHGFIRNHDDDQLLVGLLTQLVEHCTGIAKVMGANPEKA